MSILLSFQKFSKSNRKKVLTVACFIIITSAELTYSFIKKEINIVDDTYLVAQDNKIEIQKISQSLSRHSLQLQSVVMRTSFNAYIKHTDDRFKIDNGTDSQIMESLGRISGRVSGLEKIIYALNMYELRSK